MRCAGVDLAEHAADLAQFLHQVRLRLQAAGGVRDQYVGAAAARSAQGIEGHRGRICARCLCDQFGARARGPDAELLGRCCAEGVTRGKHDLESLLRVEIGEFADGRRLARTVHADHENRERLARGVDAQRLCDGPQQGRNVGLQRLEQRRHIAELLASDARA